MRPTRILAGLSHTLSATLLVALANAMPECEFRFVGILRAQDRLIRKHGFHYRCLPFGWVTPSSTSYDTPFHAGEIRHGGLLERQQSPPLHRSCALLSDVIQQEVATFKPDLILFVDAGYIVSQYLCRCAASFHIPAYGLHTMFSGTDLFFLPHGLKFASHLQAISYPDARKPSASYSPRQQSGAFCCTFDLRRSEAQVQYLRFAIERFFRLITGRPTLDTWTWLGRKITQHFLPKVLSEVRTLSAECDDERPFILALLHHPPVAGAPEKWQSLISFALACAPDGYRIVLRPHPSERWAKHIPSNLLRELNARDVYISRPGGIPLDSLLRKARAVVTISSNAAIDALKYGTPVFTLDQAFYTRPGMAQFVDMEDAGRIRSHLSQGLLPKPGAEDASCFAEFIIENFGVSLKSREEMISSLTTKVRSAIAAENVLKRNAIGIAPQ